MHDPPLTDDDDLTLNNGDMVGRNSLRVELYRQSASGQIDMRLNMKVTDLKLDHIARVFKVYTALFSCGRMCGTVISICHDIGRS